MKNQQIGDVAYTAPEVLRGEEYKNASDVYSFGMILWFVKKGTFCGRKPIWQMENTTNNWMCWI